MEKDEAGETWIFRKVDRSIYHLSPEDLERGLESVVVVVNSECQEFSDEDKEKLKLIKCIEEKYICFCGYLSNDLKQVFNHMESHKGWQDYITSEEIPPRTRNVHLNPSWRAELKEKFQSKVIDRCSQDTREAWAEKREEQNLGKFTEIRNEIIKKLGKCSLIFQYLMINLPSEYLSFGVIQLKIIIEPFT